MSSKSNLARFALDSNMNLFTLLGNIKVRMFSRKLITCPRFAMFYSSVRSRLICMYETNFAQFCTLHIAEVSMHVRCV